MLVKRTPFLAPHVLGALALLAGVAARSQAQEAWKIAPAPLLTRWAKDVTPEKARPEYPRPLWQRKDWQSLNGLWEFAFDDHNEGHEQGWSAGKTLPLRILVPFTFEAALSGIGKGSEIHERVWYRRAFTVPEGWNGRRIRLNFDACDWETTVWVNGKQLGTHRGGYDPFTLDVTEALKSSGPQEVVVAVYDPAEPKTGAYQPKGKQLGSRGIWYTRTTGIWQTVWLEPVDRAAVDLDAIQTDFDSQSHLGRLAVAITESKPAEAVRLSLSKGGRELASMEVKPDAKAGPYGAMLTINPKNVRPWSPEHPELYDLTLRATSGGKVIDEVKSYCAFRRYQAKNGRLELNGKPYFLRGVLDQGYWPDGILTPPTDDAIRNDVQTLKKLGLNMARKHVKVEDPRWYYWCDHLGVAVWQDMPSSHNLASAEAKENFRREWTHVVHATRSYPCVLHWIPFNENWGNPGPFQDEIVQLTRKLDATRPITDASGWTQRGLTDVIDAHDYGNRLIAQGVEHPVKPKVVGEYGGIALPVPGHTWTTGWGYQNARTPDALIQRIRFQTSQLYEAANLSAFVYTQLTDVEQELNGLMTYDRLPKADPARLADVFEGRDRSTKDNSPYIRDWLVLGPIPSGTTLNSAGDTPRNRQEIERILQKPYLPEEWKLHPKEGDEVVIDGRTYRWQKVHLDGDQLDFHRVFGGEKHNQVAYAVAYVESKKAQRDLLLLLGSDDGQKVWLNGDQVFLINHIRGVTPDEDIVTDMRLHEGTNSLIFKVGQGVGGWGLMARLQRKDGKPLPAR